MALKNTVTLPTGIVVPDAYHRVEDITITGKTRLRFLVKSYVAASEKVEFTHELYFGAYDIGGPNPLAQAYGHLKTLPEFAGAVDC